MHAQSSSATAIFNVGVGRNVTIRNVGGNCNKDDSNYSFATTRDGERKEISFTAKNSGRCFFEDSRSVFNIDVEGLGSIQVDFFQSFPRYIASCPNYSRSLRLKCDYGDLELRISRVNKG